MAFISAEAIYILSKRNKISNMFFRSVWSGVSPYILSVFSRMLSHRVKNGGSRSKVRFSYPSWWKKPIQDFLRKPVGSQILPKINLLTEYKNKYQIWSPKGVSNAIHDFFISLFSPLCHSEFFATENYF